MLSNSGRTDGRTSGPSQINTRFLRFMTSLVFTYCATDPTGDGESDIYVVEVPRLS